MDTFNNNDNDKILKKQNLFENKVIKNEIKDLNLNETTENVQNFFNWKQILIENYFQGKKM